MYTGKCSINPIDYQAIQTALNNNQIKKDQAGECFLTKDGKLVVSVMDDKVASFCRSRLGVFKARELYKAFDQWHIKQAATCEPRVAPKKDAAKDEDPVLEEIVTPGACGFTRDTAETATVLFPQSAEKTSPSPTGVSRYSGYTQAGTSVEFAGEKRVLPENPDVLMEIKDFFPSDGYFMTRASFERKNPELYKLVASREFIERHYGTINGYLAVPEFHISECLRHMYDKKNTRVLIEPLIDTFNKVTTQSEKVAIAGKLVDLVKNYTEASNKFTNHLTKSNEPKPIKSSDSDAEKSNTALVPSFIGLLKLEKMLTALDQYKNKVPSVTEICNTVERDNSDNGFRMAQLNSDLLSEYAKPDGVKDSIAELEKALKLLMSSPLINLKTGSICIPVTVFQRPDGPNLFASYCKQLMVIHEKMKYFSFTRDLFSSNNIIEMKDAIKTLVGFSTLLKECDSIARGGAVDQAALNG